MNAGQRSTCIVGSVLLHVCSYASGVVEAKLRHSRNFEVRSSFSLFASNRNFSAHCSNHENSLSKCFSISGFMLLLLLVPLHAVCVDDDKLPQGAFVPGSSIQIPLSQRARVHQRARMEDQRCIWLEHACVQAGETDAGGARNPAGRMSNSWTIQLKANESVMVGALTKSSQVSSVSAPLSAL